MNSLNPATGPPLAHYPEHTPAQVEAIRTASQSALRCWRNHRTHERAACLHAAADALEANGPRLAALVTQEMGKPVFESHAEIKRCVNVCRFYADHAADMLAPRTVPGIVPAAEVVCHPLGAVLGIMPWNFPFWQVMRFAAPALMAGNAVLIKHAPNVTGCALALEELLGACGMPDDLFRVLVLPEDRVAAVIEDRRVRGISLTGSCRAGSAVAAVAGRALKKTVLELGGSDPFIVLEDADLDKAVATAVGARFYNGGQTCISAQRFLVHKKVAKAFASAVAHGVSQLRVGDPQDPHTRIGPLARRDLRDTLERQVNESVRLGARVALEGGSVDGPGFYYRPVVLEGVRPGMPVFEEEVFGPVASVTSVEDAAEALRLANMTRYGLGASVWTANVSLGRKLADNLEAGAVAVNALLKSDPRLPFGGVKDSGYGRELGREGLLEFVNVKTLRTP